MSNTYKCGFCNRGYQRKTYYSRHIAICELMCKSIKERRLESQEYDDTPSIRNLYDVVLEMAIKMSAMEQKMNEMSKWVDSKKRKINIIDWLNKSDKDMESTVEDLIARIKIERRHLEYLFKEDYTGTILFVLQEMLPQDQDSNPIKAFEHKPNNLFVYTLEGADGGSPREVVKGGDGGHPREVVKGADGGNPREVVKGADGGSPREVVKGGDGGSPRWIIMTETLFQQMINVIMKQLLDEFIIWQKENTHRMDQDDFAIKYANNARKIMGGSLTREQIYCRVKLDLYKYVKRAAIPVAFELD